MARNYHVVDNSGGERNVKSDQMEVTALGALQFTASSGQTKVVYAPGAWKYVEVEMQDDRG